jgi:hypothetical protein
MFTWALFDGQGIETGTTESFTSQAEAEEWFGGNWESLAKGGTADVALRDTDGGSELYKMSLAAE